MLLNKEKYSRKIWQGSFSNFRYTKAGLSTYLAMRCTVSGMLIFISQWFLFNRWWFIRLIWLSLVNLSAKFTLFLIHTNLYHHTAKTFKKIQTIPFMLLLVTRALTTVIKQCFTSIYLPSGVDFTSFNYGG